MHALLARQLERLSLSNEAVPSDLVTWQTFLDRVSKYYSESDSGLALLERSLRLSSAEMLELNDRLRVRSQAALGLERSKFGTVIQALADGLLVLDDALTVRLANRSALHLLGTTTEQLLGKALVDLLAGDNRYREIDDMLSAIHQGTTYKTSRLSLRGPGKAPIPIAMALNPLAQGDARGAVVLFRDLTDLHRAEAVREAQELSLRLQHAAAVTLARSVAIQEGQVDLALAEITEACADTLDVFRVGVWRLSAEPDELVCDHLFELNKRAHSKGQRMSAMGMALFLQTLSPDEAASGPSPEADLRLIDFRAKYVTPHAIASMLDAPIYRGDKLLGFLFLEHTGSPRPWSLEERNFSLLAANFVALTFDAAERRLAQLELERSRRFLDSVVDNLPLMVFVKEAQSLRFVRLNKAGEDLLGLSRNDLLGKNDYDFFPAAQADFFVTKDRAVLSGTHPVDIAEEAIQTRDGPRFLHTRKIAIRDETGAPAYLLGISEDITARRSSAQELTRAKEAAERANAAKTQFIANMSHEIRTPMGAVLGLSELLLESQPAGVNRARAQGIHQAAQALLRIINDILDVSRIEAGRMELLLAPFSPNGLARQVLALLGPMAHAKGLTINLEVGHMSCDLFIGDEGRLRQILINLVGNAIKFTDKGQVTIEVATETTSSDRTRVTWEVHDTGPGISGEHLPGLFDPFTQVDSSQSRTHGGTGLGLHIAREIVRLMGGDLNVSSVKGVGSTFRVEVPLEVADASEPRPADVELPCAEAEPTDEVSLSILVAEDNLLNQELVRTMLEQAGHRVTMAGDGQLALTAFARERYHCVLMDCQMPNLDGIEATRRLRRMEQEEARPQTPVIALTASAMTGDRERFLEAGMTGFIAKPFSRASLLSAIARYAGRPQGAPAGEGSSSDDASRPV